mmetsp:Transcript_4231/g.16523  ORF Transcript_4231/g.16523 Transcript_4231/m.16523 type:complete len:478 (-) Transcript_4231:1425-2858(-)|eukprot:scaffold3575_cov254-Pinguiococcus_pyrenoidosus.AAC.7
MTICKGIAISIGGHALRKWHRYGVCEASPVLDAVDFFPADLEAFQQGLPSTSIGARLLQFVLRHTGASSEELSFPPRIVPVQLVPKGGADAGNLVRRAVHQRLQLAHLGLGISYAGRGSPLERPSVFLLGALRLVTRAVAQSSELGQRLSLLELAHRARKLLFRGGRSGFQDVLHGLVHVYLGLKSSLHLVALPVEGLLHAGTRLCHGATQQEKRADSIPFLALGLRRRCLPLRRFQRTGLQRLLTACRRDFRKLLQIVPEATQLVCRLPAELNQGRCLIQGAAHTFPVRRQLVEHPLQIGIPALLQRVDGRAGCASAVPGHDLHRFLQATPEAGAEALESADAPLHVARTDQTDERSQACRAHDVTLDFGRFCAFVHFTRGNVDGIAPGVRIAFCTASAAHEAGAPEVTMRHAVLDALLKVVRRAHAILVDVEVHLVRTSPREPVGRDEAAGDADALGVNAAEDFLRELQAVLGGR